MNLTKFFIDQHGCAKNQTDGEILAGYLIKNGFELTENPLQADFIIVNSCGFIESAKKESIDAVYSIKNSYPNAKIILAGCLAERYAQMFYDSMPEIDGIFGNGDLSKIVDFMKSVQNEGRSVQTFEQKGVCGGERPVLFNFPASAFVKITEGCSNHCSFCAIPLIRGELRSRPVSKIIEEIKSLVQDGIYEINLIGQDLAAYGTEKTFSDSVIQNNPFKSPLSVLFSEISKIPGNFIIRPLYIHPDHFSEDILEPMQKDSRFVPYFDIPFQSGDDKIILAMNRTGSKKQYQNLVEKIRQKLPDAVLRTTFLTGFPGETQEAADNTYDFLRTIQPDWSGCFTYSREEDTPAYDMKPRVPAKIAKKRAEALEELQASITSKKLESYVGKEFDVLIEEIINSAQTEQSLPVQNEYSSENFDNEETEGLAIGRAWFQAPEVDGCVVIRYDLDCEEHKKAVKPGNVVRVKIVASTGVDLDSRFKKIVKEFPQNQLRKFTL